MRFKPKTLFTLAMLMAMSATAIAQDGEKPGMESSMLYAPLVYDSYQLDAGHKSMPSPNTGGLYSLDAGDAWLQEAMETSGGSLPATRVKANSPSPRHRCRCPMM